MAVIFAPTVGKPFKKNVTQELNRRQNATTFNAYESLYDNAYFALYRTDGTPSKDNVSPKVLDNKKYSSFVSSPRNLWNYSQGGITQAPPIMTKLSVKVEDYAFYIMDVDFEISEISHFEDFKKMWLGFGLPVKIIIGKKGATPTQDTEEFEDVNNLVMYGAIVKFNYSLNKDSGGQPNITGKITIFSISALMSVDTISDDASYTMDDFRNDMLVEFRNIVSEGKEESYYACITESFKQKLQDAITIQEGKKNSSWYAGVFSLNEKPTQFLNPLHKDNSNNKYVINDIPDNPSANYIDQIFAEGGSMMQLFISNLSLDSSLFNTSIYFYVSLKEITNIIQKFFEKRNQNYVVDMYSEKIKTLTTIPYSKNPEVVIFNPLSVSSDITMGDIYVSASSIYKIAENARSVFEFMETLISIINDNSGGINKFKKIQIDKNGTGGSQYVGYFDEHMIGNNQDDTEHEYFELDPLKKYSVFDNISIDTEVDGSISDYVFFKTNSRYSSNPNIVQDEKNNNSPLKYAFSMIEGFVFNNQSNAIDFTIDQVILQNLDYIKNITESSSLNKKQRVLLTSIYLYLKAFPQLQIELLKLKGIVENNNQNNIKIPLKISYRMPGMSGVKIGQTFKVKSELFPASFNLDDRQDETVYLINSLSHELEYKGVDTSWYTTVSGIMFVPFVKVKADGNEFTTLTRDAEETLKYIRDQYRKGVVSAQTQVN